MRCPSCALARRWCTMWRVRTLKPGRQLVRAELTAQGLLAPIVQATSTDVNELAR